MVFKFKNTLLILSSVLSAVSALKTYDHCQNPGEIALAFDDGPNLETTNKILDVLDKENVKATFFINGQNEFDIKNNAKAR
eukprot:jgi/Orpsp1_1/1184618/evm.model.c7180000090285.1